MLWQSGQHQPDQLAALVVAHDVAVHAAGARMEIAAPVHGSLADGASSVVSIDHARRRMGLAG